MKNLYHFHQCWLKMVCYYNFVKNQILDLGFVAIHQNQNISPKEHVAYLQANLAEIIEDVVEDFNQDLINQNKKIEIVFKNKIKNNDCYVFGISNRLEQVIANLLDNSISFSQYNQKIEVGLEETSTNILMSVKDEGPGFSETSPQKIFKRFYSNRPKSFGKHSGLGLNIVKNIVQLHKGTVAASNRLNNRGAQVEVLLPKLS